MQSTRQSFDFHCHSTASDGTLSPGEMFKMALEAGLQQWSLTDHDTLSGYDDITLTENSQIGLQLIPGVELSCDWRGITVHILAYGFDAQENPMREFLSKQQVRRKQRAQKIGDRIEQKLKVRDACERAGQLSGNDFPARPHFARLLVNEGVTETVQEAFRKYLGAGKWGDVKLFWPGLDEVMQAINAANGKSVIAHPFHYKMTATKLRRLLDEFGSLNGDGVELGVPNVNNGQYGWLVDELYRRGMIQSGGSDFHGSATPWARLGYFPSLSKKIPSLADLLTS